MAKQFEEITADLIEELSGRVKKVELNLADDAGVARERRAAQRERRLLSDERTASEASNAAAAESLMAIKTSFDEAVAAAQVETEKKQRLAQSSMTLMQDMRNGLEMELVESKQAINQLLQEKVQLEVDMLNLKNDLATYKDRLNVTDDGVRKSVFSAAETAVKDMSRDVIKAEVERQMRQYMRSEAQNDA